MIERLEIIKKRYDELNAMLLDPEILKDVKKTTELSKEAKELEAPVEAYKKLLQINSDMEAAKEMSKDPEMGEFAKEELENLTSEKENLLGLFGTLSEDEQHSLINEVLTKTELNYIVTPTEIDFLIDKLSNLIAKSLNIALHRQIN